MTYYRLYFFNPSADSLIRGEELLEAASDADAIHQAERHTGDWAMELWSGQRQVAQFGATDLAVRNS